MTKHFSLLQSKAGIVLLAMYAALFVIISLFPIPADAKELSGAEVKQLVSGNTVEAVHPSRGYSIITYHSPDGTYRQQRDGEAYSGKWYVDDEGRLCMMRTGWGGECRLIKQEGKVWKAYKVPGNPLKGLKHERTFNKVTKGNSNNL